MAYQTYTTEALVCGNFSKGGADKSFRLFTREAGMLYATARSVREERSKQRYALQDFTLVRVSLVRGKADWRIGSVESRSNHLSEAADRRVRGLVVGGIKLMNRFMPGEGSHPQVFDECLGYLQYLNQFGSKSQEQALKLFELRLLYLLGYIKTTDALGELLRFPASYAELLSSFASDTGRSVELAIQNGREASHL